MLTKKIIITIVIILGIVGSYLMIFKNGVSKDSSQPQNSNQIPTPQDSKYATVVSTNPADLQNGIILPTQTIEITFSDPVVNTDELKHTMDPDGGYTLKLSSDRKTLSIIPSPAFKLGTGYTFIIRNDYTKFDNGKKLESDVNYHFNTIDYKGV